MYKKHFSNPCQVLGGFLVCFRISAEVSKAFSIEKLWNSGLRGRTGTEAAALKVKVRLLQSWALDGEMKKAAMDVFRAPAHGSVCFFGSSLKLHSRYLGCK